MRSKWLRILVPVGALLALVFALSSCGGDNEETSGEEQAGIPEEFAAPTAAPDDAQQGGDLTVLFESDIDYMDPGAAYYQPTYTVDFATLRQLLSWQPDDVEEPTPDLADGEPEISDDSKTVTFHIKSGIRFSPPVNREVTSADIKYAIERSL